MTSILLANKFLDDNTFTNKTWSEVSGMKVIDLNIMELEFLDVLRFKLSIRKEEYERWRTALFGFRNELINVPIEIQRQKLMETMALSVSNNHQQQQQWIQQQQHPSSHQQVSMQQHQQHQQQQHQQATAAAVAASHNFYLFSKAQQQFPVQPTFNGPLARVPLRIPARPVYHNIQTTPSAPPNVMNVNIYDMATNSTSNTPSPSNPNTTATTTTNSTSNRYSTGNRRPVDTGFAPYQKQQPQQQQQLQQQSRLPPSSIPPSTNNPIVVNSSRPTTPSSNMYSAQKQSPYPTPYSHNGSSNNTTPTNTNARGSHRTSSLPQQQQQGGLDLNVKNSTYYYATPSPTNNSNLYQQQQQQQQQPVIYPTAATTTTTSYYVDHTPQTTATVTTTNVLQPISTNAMSTSPADYNPYVSATTNNMNDAYNRPMIPRSTSYKVIFNHIKI